jgi:rare lipoprotein A
MHAHGFAVFSSFSLFLATALAFLVAGCGSSPKRGSAEAELPRPAAKTSGPAPASRSSRGGGYYLDDGPGEAPPDLESVAEPVPQIEPLHRGAMRPYIVLGQSFTPMTELVPYKARGVATWYGRRYHGRQTSTGEIYDMYAISAAHPTLPLPSYARVTNLQNGKSVVVRVNDRGPFIDNRLIDLSYTAAHRLRLLAGGSGLVEVETIIPDAATNVARAAGAPPAARPVQERAAASPSALSSSAPAAPIASGTQASDSDPIHALVTASAVHETPTLTRETPQTAPSSQAPALAPAGIYLQLGAFGSRDNAEGFLARAKARAEWLSQRLQLVSSSGLHRVHAGPYASAAEARIAADRIASSFGARPLVITR